MLTLLAEAMDADMPATQQPESVARGRAAVIYHLSARHADLAAATPMPTPDMGGVGGVLEWLETQRMRGRSGGGAYRLCRWSRSKKWRWRTWEGSRTVTGGDGGSEGES